MRLNSEYLQEQYNYLTVIMASQQEPQYYWSQNLRIKAPLAPEDAKCLRDIFCERYRAWTGRELVHDLENDRRLSEPRP